jgi:methylated-DNA-[protein]-cysteine S-methyltransferase
MTQAVFLAPERAATKRYWSELTLPLGGTTLDLVLVGDGDALVGVYFGSVPDRVGRRGEWVRDEGALREASEQLRRYSAAESTRFDLALRPAGTAFQLDVWSQLVDIPYGTTTTYGRVAAAIGRPSGSRAVGAAVGANPIGIIIPCHRVVGADGSLTGFAGGLDTKVALLRTEGITAF